jgi:hypothetical protein
VRSGKWEVGSGKWEVGSEKGEGGSENGGWGEGLWGGHGGAEIVVTSVASPATMRFLRSGQVFVPVAVRNAEGDRGFDASPGIC